MRIRQFAFQALLASSVVVCATAASAQDPATQALVGTWNLTMTSPNGTHPSTVTIKDEAGKLAGTMTGELGSLPVDVKTTETGVSLSFTVDYQGQPVPVVMNGKVDGATIKGTVDYANGGAAGDFTGTKSTAAGVSAATPPCCAAGAAISGLWEITGSGAGYSLQLTQDGTAVTGVLKTPSGTDLPVKGTFESGALTLAVTLDSGPGVIKGALDGAALTGTYDIAGSAGSFSATRKP